MMQSKIKYLFFLLLVIGTSAHAQAPKSVVKNYIYIDKKGIIRYSANHQKAYFFGVNYTAPFAYGYRALGVLGIDRKKEIDADVYHLARMGIDAFRVHVWDTEITDAAGNLLQNEHLQLFDYLVAQLEKRHIKILLTPLAFWGNGYPEKDKHTAGFSSIYDKGQVTINETAIRAQENYLKQFLQHTNPYNRLAYRDDPNIIAAELNNEPKHSGPKNKVTEYVNRLVAAAQNAGWKKPLFYNISESFTYADAVAKSNVNGFSFQWYPVGLVARHENFGNFLPNVDHYKIPFLDTIPEFKNKARLIYEFDTGDLLQSCMYPAMARSFKKAGIQWATQFAYDPLATAYANTEYQTHYLNLAYTPSKAISLLIASKVFHQLPENQKNTDFPADSIFDAYRVSYKQNLSLMNTSHEFAYSNNTTVKPVDVAKLQHIAGVGSSAIVQYSGYGAYFLDRLENGIWRLEVMPDAISIRDPFAQASLKKEVTRIQYESQQMQILLPDLSQVFHIEQLNKEGNASFSTQNSVFNIEPGTYLITKKGVQNKHWSAQSTFQNLHLGEFVAPKPIATAPFVVDPGEINIPANQPFTLKIKVVGVDTSHRVVLQINQIFGQYRTIAMARKSAYDYEAKLPFELLSPGLLNYQVFIKKTGQETIAFPGNFIGDPYAWDNFHHETWSVFVASPQTAVKLFQADQDLSKLIFYLPDYHHQKTALVAAEETGKLAIKISSEINKTCGWQLFVGDRLKNFKSEATAFTKLIIRAKTDHQPIKIKIALIDVNAASYAAYVAVDERFRDIEVSLNSLRPDSALLLPRPYPSFQPLWFKANSFGAFRLDQLDKLEIMLNENSSETNADQPKSLVVESVWLAR
ncbi:MAG: hypothetical protein ACRYFB_08795 [Janthinobacterium lividum]